MADILQDEALARFCAEQSLEKLGGDVVALNVRDISSIADYIVIVTATSVPHLKALGGHLEDSVREKFQRRPLTVDGEPVSEWVLIDFGSVIVHVFSRDAREFYNLEKLYAETSECDISTLLTQD